MSAADTAATILLVEDDAPTRTFLADNLTADGYELLVADCARDGLRLLETKFPDVALVDLGLPDGSGLDIVRRVRASDGVASRIDPALPLMVLSGRAGELDRLRGFERGCDDYVCKPFSYPELRARVEALLRRADVRRRPGRLRVGELEIDAAARVVRLRGTPIDLSQKEFALVRTLASDPTRVFTKDELLRTIWGFRTLGSTRTLDSHACRLRHKLARGGERFVVNVWGVGYRLVDGPPAELAVPEPAPALAPAAAVAALPLMAVGRPLDAVALVRVAAGRRRPRRRGLLRIRAAPAARARGAGVPRAARPADRGAPGAARRRAPRRRSARAPGRHRPRARAGPRSRSTTSPPRATGAASPTATSRSTSATCSPTRRSRGGWSTASSAAGSSSPSRARARWCAATACAWRRRSATSWPTRSSTATDGCACWRARRATGCASRSPTRAPGLPAPVGDLTRRPRAGRGRRGRGLAIAADIADRHGGRLVAAPAARGARVALELPAWRDPA